MKFRREDGTFDTDEFEHAVDVVFLAQEIVVGPSSYPTEKIGDNARAFRQLGLGYANLGALLMSDGVPYDSDEGRNIAGAITALMTGRGYRKSAEIAAAVGPYDGYAQEPRAPQQRHADAPRRLLRARRPTASRATWSPPRSAAGTRRSSSATSTATATRRRPCSAPTGTISFLMDCDTTGIEPDFSLVKFKELVGGGQMTIVNRTVPMALRDARLLSDGDRADRGLHQRQGHDRRRRRRSGTSTCRCSTSRSASARSRTWATSR